MELVNHANFAKALTKLVLPVLLQNVIVDQSLNIMENVLNAKNISDHNLLMESNAVLLAKHVHQHSDKSDWRMVNAKTAQNTTKSQTINWPAHQQHARTTPSLLRMVTAQHVLNTPELTQPEESASQPNARPTKFWREMEVARPAQNTKEPTKLKDTACRAHAVTQNTMMYLVTA